MPSTIAVMQPIAVTSFFLDELNVPTSLEIADLFNPEGGFSCLHIHLI